MRIHPIDHNRPEDYELVTMNSHCDEELASPVMSSNSENNQDMQLHDGEQEVGISTLYKVLIVSCICCFCCSILGFILMVIFGGVCTAGQTWACGVGGPTGGFAMLLIGMSPFVIFILVVIYNSLYFCTFIVEGKPADSKHWPVLQI